MHNSNYIYYLVGSQVIYYYLLFLQIFENVEATLSKSWKEQHKEKIYEILERIEKLTGVKIMFMKGQYVFRGTFRQIVSVYNELCREDGRQAIPERLVSADVKSEGPEETSDGDQSLPAASEQAECEPMSIGESLVQQNIQSLNSIDENDQDDPSSAVLSEECSNRPSTFEKQEHVNASNHADKSHIIVQSLSEKGLLCGNHSDMSSSVDGNDTRSENGIGLLSETSKAFPGVPRDMDLSEIKESTSPKQSSSLVDAIESISDTSTLVGVPALPSHSNDVRSSASENHSTCLPDTGSSHHLFAKRYLIYMRN